MGIFKLNGVNYMGGGGGTGDANYEELTQVEYDALTTEEKNNGTMYFITDTTVMTPNKFQPIIYSTDEREIGVWADGKPLYEKTLYYAGATSGQFSIPHGISNLERAVYGIGSFHDNYGDNGSDVILPRISNDGYHCGISAVNKTEVIIFIPTVFSTRPVDIYVTIQYTKTNDEAGSGLWTPQGTPAQHYSTEEQVIGTWVDGSTLYEKSYYIASPTKDNWASMADISTWGIDVIVELVGVYKRSWSESNSQQSIPYYESTNVYASLRVHSNGQFQYRLHDESNNSVSDLKATIRYTKTS